MLEYFLKKMGPKRPIFYYKFYSDYLSEAAESLPNSSVFFVSLN